MKILFSLLMSILFFSCNKNFIGTYNTSYLKDKSVFFQIKLNVDYSVEKTEVHTIGDFAKGKFVFSNNHIFCFFDSSTNKFPPDTMTFIKKGRKLYFKKKRSC